MQFSAQSNSNKLSSIFSSFPLSKKACEMQFHFEITLLFRPEKFRNFSEREICFAGEGKSHNLHL